MKWKNVCLVSTFATALLFTACNKDDNEENSDVSSQDKTFIAQASHSNRAEVELGNMALSKSTNDSVKMYAQMMVTEHTAAQIDLQTVVANVYAGVDLNDSLEPDQIAMRNMLMAMSGRAFDSTYIVSQITGHQKTLTAVDTEIASGSNAQVKGYATNKRPSIQTHLDLANAIRVKL